jgi:glycosyltransferase involved in cell wall biosynthesis
MMLTTLFFAAILPLLWAYVGYPLAVAVLGRLLPRPAASSRPLGDSWLLISAYNEESMIRRKLENALELDPCGRMHVVVVSDGSTDATDGIAAAFAARHARFSLLRVEGRGGKNHALNEALERLSPGENDVIVFSDANALYQPEAIRYLRNALRDGAACAVGQLRFVDGSTGTARAEGLYWRYENFVKAAEGRVGRSLVANGAIFAARAADVPQLPLGVGNDFWVPVVLLGEGKAVTYEPRALALEAAPQHSSEEFQRKLRMANRSMGGTLRAWTRLDAGTRFQLVSHKVIRWLGLPLYAVAVSSAIGLAAGRGAFFGAALVLLAPLALAVVGGLSRLLGKRLPVADLAVHFLLVHVAALLGVFEALVGKRRFTWKQARSARRVAA